MITKDIAIQKVESYLVDLSKRGNCSLALMLKETLEFEFGWVFFYQSKEYIETGDIMEMVGGNAPLIINKNNGELTVTGTAYPVEYYIEEYIEKMKKI